MFEVKCSNIFRLCLIWRSLVN